MPHSISTEEQRAVESAKQAQVVQSQQSRPPDAYRYTELPDVPHESILHPVKAVQDIIHAIDKNTAIINLLLQRMEKDSVFVDRWFGVGASVGYEINYYGYLYVSVFTTVNAALFYSTGGGATINANRWTHISPPKGSIITISGGNDASPQPLLFRAANVVYTS